MPASTKPGKRESRKRSSAVSARKLKPEIEESEGPWRALLDSALDCVLCTDRAGKITEFNLMAERTFRIGRNQALGNDLAQTIFPPRLQAQHRRELFTTIAATGLEIIGNRLETTAVRADGSEFPSELTVTSIVINNKDAFIVYVRDITARKRAEEAVLWTAAIVESSSDAIIGKNLEGVIMSWNQGAEVMYGYSASEAIGQKISVLIPSGRADEFPRVMEQLRSGRRIVNFETVRIAKDGRLLNVSLTMSPVLDSDGAAIGASVIARDITAHKAAEEALRKANETSIYASPVPIVAADPQNRITMWNAAAEAVFGWRESEVLGQPNPIIPPEAAASSVVLHRRLLSGETITGMEVVRRRRDGALVAISLSASPLWDQNRRVRGIIGFLTDITDRKRAEETLRRAEEKYRGIFENALEGIYQATLAGNYISANPALARMLGFDSPEDLIRSRNDIANQEYVTPHSRAEFLRELDEHGVVQRFEYQAYRKDGKPIWVSASAHPVRDATGQISYYEGTVQDITERRELEEQLRQMQKIEAVGRLAGGVAHDFNNILMAISSYSELLEAILTDATSQRYVKEIEKATNRGSSLTQSLLAFSRKQVYSPKVLDLNRVIEQQIDMLRRLIPENVSLKFLPDASAGRVKADPSQLEQIVMNLVINSRDAMPNGGEVLVTTGDAMRAPRESGPLPAPNGGPYVVLTVRDSGSGMDAETKSHIFEPFFTTKDQGKGTGLGLATVFGIVKQNAGHIAVESEVGVGTAVQVSFPRVDDEIEFSTKLELPASVRGSETILLVEDEQSVREPAAEYLLGNGYNVLKASDGLEALQVAEQYKQPIHLLLTDVVMPQMSGRELSDKLTLIHPEAKIVFMSGYSRNLISTREVLDTHHILVQKPFRLATLGKCIRDALAQQSSQVAQ